MEVGHLSHVLEMPLQEYAPSRRSIHHEEELDRRPYRAGDLGLRLHSDVDGTGQIAQPGGMSLEDREQTRARLLTASSLAILDGLNEFVDRVGVGDAFLEELAAAAKLGKSRSSAVDGLAVEIVVIPAGILAHRGIRQGSPFSDGEYRLGAAWVDEERTLDGKLARCMIPPEVSPGLSRTISAQLDNGSSGRRCNEAVLCKATTPDHFQQNVAFIEKAPISTRSMGITGF